MKIGLILLAAGATSCVAAILIGCSAAWLAAIGYSISIVGAFRVGTHLNR